MVSTTNSPARWAAAHPSAGDSPVFALAGIRKATFLHLIMKISMLHLGFILIAGAVAASAADELPAPKISDKNTAAVAPSAATSDKIMAALPKYDPAPTAVPATPAEPKPGDPVNADMLVLPKMVVKQKP